LFLKLCCSCAGPSRALDHDLAVHPCAARVDAWLLHCEHQQVSHSCFCVISTGLYSSLSPAPPQLGPLQGSAHTASQKQALRH
jgi:hypothetical protein